MSKKAGRHIGMIELCGLTKYFAGGKGIFDLNLKVPKGEVFGFLGPNGAGKSTTIRHLMGFIQPDRGTARIAGMDCWAEAAEIQKKVGYCPGEIALFEGMSGREFLELMAQIRKVKDFRKRDQLIERFQLQIDVPIRKMSKGMKQKLSIVCAFMHDPECLILDEPTSGLDPLMQREFISLIHEEKRQGKTIFMSSHQFQEIERACDRVGIIKDGKLVSINHIQEMRQIQRKVFEVTLAEGAEWERLKEAGLSVRKKEKDVVEIEVQGDLNPMIRALSRLDVRHLEAKTLDLEEVFMHFYERKEGITG
jgi:ABC-2 type transport system ATP-binding protein